MMRNRTTTTTTTTVVGGVGRHPVSVQSAKPSSVSPVSVAIDISTIDQVVNDRLDVPSLTYPIKATTKRPLNSQRKKYVSIAKDDAVVHEVEGRHQYSPEEVEATWFSRNDVAKIKSEHKSLINRMRIRKDHHTSAAFDNDDVCTRGLECQSKAGSKLRRQVQIKAMVAVFEEQERHRRKRRASAPAGAGTTTNQNVDGDNDENDIVVQAIAIVYRQCSYHSQQAAANMGRRDEHAIADYYRPSLTTAPPNNQNQRQEAEEGGPYYPMSVHPHFCRQQQHHHQQILPHRAVVGGRLSKLSSSPPLTFHAQQPRRHLNLGLSTTAATSAAATVNQKKSKSASDLTRIPRRASAA